MNGSYWQRDAGWRDRWVGVPRVRSADFAVLGAGLAGLTTAIRLREQNPHASIVVLEAERVGFGASGRSAGFLSPLAAPVWLLGAERSPDQAWAAARLNAHVHAIARWIGEYVPDGELAPCTLRLRSDNRLAGSALREFTSAVALVGLEHRRTERALEMAAYTMHPYKLVRGLAEHAERLGVGIFERTRVREVVGLRSGGARVHAGEHVLEAGKVVVCTNAYTRSIELGERVRAAVVHSFMTATAPVGRPDGEFVVEINPAQTYHRAHRGRILFGGIDALSAPEHDVPERELERLVRRMKKSFPHLDFTIDDAWSGRFHATPTGLPIIRTSEENFAIVFNVGYGGTGVALALACAPLAACVASNGRWHSADDTRLLSVMHRTRISIRDSLRALARIARGAAMPWAHRAG